MREEGVLEALLKLFLFSLSTLSYIKGKKKNLYGQIFTESYKYYAYMQSMEFAFMYLLVICECIYF